MQSIQKGADAATASASDFPFQALMQQMERVAQQLSKNVEDAVAAAAGSAGAALDCLLIEEFSKARISQPCKCTRASSPIVTFSHRNSTALIFINQAWDRFVYVYFDLVNCLSHLSVEAESHANPVPVNKCVGMPLVARAARSRDVCTPRYSNPLTDFRVLGIRLFAKHFCSQHQQAM